MNVALSYEELKILRNALDTEAIRLEPIAGSDKKIHKIEMLTDKIENLIESFEPDYYYRAN